MTIPIKSQKEGWRYSSMLNYLLKVHRSGPVLSSTYTLNKVTKDTTVTYQAVLKNTDYDQSNKTLIHCWSENSMAQPLG